MNEKRGNVIIFTKRRSRKNEGAPNPNDPLGHRRDIWKWAQKIVGEVDEGKLTAQGLRLLARYFGQQADISELAKYAKQKPKARR